MITNVLNCFLNSVSTAVVSCRAVLPCYSLLYTSCFLFNRLESRYTEILYFKRYLGKADMQQHHLKQLKAKT